MECCINNKHYILMSNNGEDSTVIKQMFRTNNGYNEILKLGQEVIKSLKFMHSLGIVHCDVKPSNILYRKDDSGVSMFTLIDFGISRRYLDVKNKHVCKQRLVSFAGSIEFVATDCLKKYYPTRKHDLESLLYTMMYLFTSQCPYGEISHGYATSKVRMIHQLENREKAARFSSKLNISLAKLLVRNIEINSSFVDFAECILNLEYEEEPDYEMLIKLLEKCKESECKLDTIYDTQAIQSNSASIQNIGSTGSGNPDDIFKNTLKFSECKSDSGIFADNEITLELGRSLLRKKSFFSKKNNEDNDSDSEEEKESEFSESLYYTCKDGQENISHDSKKSLPSINGCGVLINSKCNSNNILDKKETYDWDNFDVASFEEHKCTHQDINFPESIVNYRK